MNEESAMNFWGRVEQAQQLENRSLRAICNETGISYKTIMNAKSYARLPSLEVASKLANELHCSIDWLLLGSDKTVTVDNESQLVRQILSDPRKKAIVEKIASSNQSALFSIEYLLGIRK